MQNSVDRCQIELYTIILGNASDNEINCKYCHLG
jgi:hypothetical protein